ncbi:MAG: right-handed parallel beta-helix repeat-containing protein [Verrucomicrobiaceae bacterium]|nr:right-handed parallel beta-helix repeat-containing protein [Verrucomicrobiaceae bacterium]
MITRLLLLTFAITTTSRAADLRVPVGFKTVQSAIHAAKAGDSVLVQSGTYRENLTLKPGVMVKSVGADEKGKLGLTRAEVTILEGSVEMADKAVLDGFTITGVGIYDEKLWQHHFDTQGNEQPHEHIGADGKPGIAVATNCTVTNNIVHHIGYTGIAITGGSPRIANNVCFRNMGGGIGSMKGSKALIEKNECFENFYAGIGCDGSSPTIKDNNCHDNIRAGIGISEESSPNVTGNRCFNNRRAGIGIRTGAETRPVVERNECRDNAMAGIGVEEGARPTLRKNKLINNKLVAIGVSGGARAVIRENELSREGGVPPMIAVLEDSSAEIRENTIRGGGVAAIVIKGGAKITQNHFVAPTPKKLVLVFKGAAVTESENMFLKDAAFTSNLDGTGQRYVELVPSDAALTAVREVVIALHGHGSDRWQFIKDMRGECRGLRDVAAKHGLIFISPDYRAKTSWMGPAAEADMLQIIAEVKKRHRVNRVFIAGGSMGGTSALIFAALHPELIAGVCALNPTANLVDYAGFKDAIDTSYGSADERHKRSPELHADRLTMPVALTTGGKDTVVPPASTLRLAKKLPRVLSLHREDVAHSTSYDDTVKAMEFVLQTADDAKAPAKQP